MTNKAKKRIRETAQKTGAAYQTIVNQKRAAQPAVRDPVDDVIADLKASHISSVLVGRTPVRAIAATRELAFEIGRAASANPSYFAESEHVQMTVSRADHDALLRRGATLYEPPARHVQHVRLGYASKEQGQSVQCATCTRWLWCGEEGEGNCICGQPMLIRFDGSGAPGLPHGLCCMDCGRAAAGSWLAGVETPWRAIGSRQCVCEHCVKPSYTQDPQRHVTSEPRASLRAELRARRLAASKAATMAGTTSEQIARAKLQGLGWTEWPAAKSRQAAGVTKCVMRRVGDSGTVQMADGETWAEVLIKAEKFGPA